MEKNNKLLFTKVMIKTDTAKLLLLGTFNSKNLHAFFEGQLLSSETSKPSLLSIKKGEAVCYSYFIAAELWFCKRLCNV